MFTVIDNDGRYVFTELNDVIQHIQLIYFNDDICMSEILAGIEVQGLTLEGAAELYMELRNWAGDGVSMIDENGDFVL